MDARKYTVTSSAAVDDATRPYFDFLRVRRQRCVGLLAVTLHRLGGAVCSIDLDNLRERVVRPAVNDSTINPLFRDSIAH
ncbi:hypothetical protein [Gemmatimonas groenlandica]|uniref:Uncharacterized protein n=1 Tax=Gemmatimonas groenlandica TaxID=2732249 RepID=A0A6M4IRM0_9BACT|nr:hypothetical protein [Gemmatimonas groenlandica]QJR36775.1 hypothetical protein HKW67_15250 [Gemmatimonas groenlandica]